MPEQLPDETAVQLVFIVLELPCLSTSRSIALKDTKINDADPGPIDAELAAGTLTWPTLGTPKG